MIGRIIDRWAARRQAAELQSLLAILAELNRTELAELVVIADHVRKGMQMEGNDVMKPFDLIVRRPTMPLELVRAVEGFRRQGNHVAASALMVWAHTMRAALRPTLVPLARQMWRELARGFDGIEEAAASLRIRLSTPFDPRDATNFPMGFDPRF
ncbi:hypothetical protein C1M51_02890 [Methylibium sp. Pch-M]|uniref:hypothetical protein n=1 Tax=Methylibium sp. Pch-M TaxID=2082386 RepID=UPI0010114E81|nr:hypothetical protein [Methylibium sp. Pch-M]QAZ38451.1 hypothetical protein C1M51_02890 [Methylibium sp. Pch-M]